MRERDAIAVSVCLSTTVMCVLYVVQPTAPIYYPLEHVWRWEKLPGLPSMAWYGRSLWALAAGSLTLFFALPLTRRLARRSAVDAPRWLAPAASALTLLALCFALGHTVVHEVSVWMK